VNEVGEVTTVVKDHVERLAVREHDRLLDAPLVLLLGLSLPGVDGDAGGGHRGGGLVLGREDVARAPRDLRAQWCA
jgi:hypothetical protein